MAITDLHSVVDKMNNNEDNSLQKVQFGYVVKQYDTVLALLKQRQQKKEKEEANNAGISPDSVAGGSSLTFKRWTEADSINVYTNISNDGFVVNTEGGQDDYEAHRQQRVRFRGFMSFAVTLKDEKGKELPHFVSYKSFKDSLDSGLSQRWNNKTTYLPSVVTPTVCNTIGGAIGNMNNSCEMGIAVDLTAGTGTADYFFKKCYSEIYQKGISSKLVSCGALMAEVAFANGSTATTLHARVITTTGGSPENGPHDIYLPIPVLLTNTYNTLIKVEVDDGTRKVVGKDCKYPFASAKYNHLDGTLEGFSPQYFKEVLSNKKQVAGVYVNFNTDALSHVQPECGFIRFYIDKNKEAEAAKIFGKEIPAKYRPHIFQGVKSAKMGLEIVDTGDVDIIGSNMNQILQSVASMIDNKLNVAQIARAEGLVAKFEGAGRWDAWNPQDKKEGASIGRHQMSSRSGKVKEYLEVYKRMGGTVSDGFWNEAVDAVGKSYVHGSKMLPYRGEFADQAATDMGKAAQLEIFFKHTAKKACSYFKKFGCQTALELSSIIGAVNHWPGGMIYAYKAYESQIINARSNTRRAELLEKCHMAANYVAQSMGINQTVKVESYSKIPSLDNLTTSLAPLAGWRGRHEKMLKLASSEATLNNF